MIWKTGSGSDVSDSVMFHTRLWEQLSPSLTIFSQSRSYCYPCLIPFCGRLSMHSAGNLCSLISTPSNLCCLEIPETRTIFFRCAVSPRKN